MFQEISVSTKRSQYASRGLRGFPSSFWGAPGDLRSTPGVLGFLLGPRGVQGLPGCVRRISGSLRGVTGISGLSTGSQRRFRMSKVITDEYLEFPGDFKNV